MFSIILESNCTITTVQQRNSHNHHNRTTKAATSLLVATSSCHHHWWPFPMAANDQPPPPRWLPRHHITMSPPPTTCPNGHQWPPQSPQLPTTPPAGPPRCAMCIKDPNYGLYHHLGHRHVFFSLCFLIYNLTNVYLFFRFKWHWGATMTTTMNAYHDQHTSRQTGLEMRCVLSSNLKYVF